MTRRDYVLLAAALEHAVTHARRIVPEKDRSAALTGIEIAATSLCKALHDANPLFDRERFMLAAGLA